MTQVEARHVTCRLTNKTHTLQDVDSRDTEIKQLLSKPVNELKQIEVLL